MTRNLARVWRLMRPYWTSTDRWVALGLLSLLLLMLVGDVKYHAWAAELLKKVYDAGAQGNAAEFWLLAILMVVGIFGYAVLWAARGYVNQFLEIRWRQGTTEYFMKRWLKDRRFFVLERDQLVENPDQRISEDVKIFVHETFKWSFDFLRNIGYIVVFGPML